ncbi:MAG: LysR family transcriptional regulator [Betaproteobacteria bacterium]|nr:LysR family transcriptional regulator [Betaproteobacteria bacterium]
MHTSYTVEFDHAWLGGRDLPRERGRALLRLLAELAQADSLRAAAQRSGLSYRSAWGALADGARLFGAPLVDMQRGRRARLSALGVRVLAADERVRNALGAHFERLRAEIPAFLADALPGARPRLTIHASHDLALAELGALCRATLDLEVVFRGADDCLASLARGECDMAGFHVADALPRAAAAAAALGRWLDPRKHTLLHFVTREQGLIARPGSRIRGVHDLARPGVRFIHRQSRSADGDERSVADAVAAGRADAGFGLRADATRHKLAFTPLATERYFFAGAKAALRGAALKALLETLKGPAFAARVARLPGYDASHCGRREALDAALTWVKQA